MTRPGKIKKLVLGKPPHVVFTVGEEGLLSIQGTQTGSFLLEYNDKYAECGDPQYYVELTKTTYVVQE